MTPPSLKRLLERLLASPLPIEQLERLAATWTAAAEIIEPLVLEQEALYKELDTTRDNLTALQTRLAAVEGAWRKWHGSESCVCPCCQTARPTPEPATGAAVHEKARALVERIWGEMPDSPILPWDRTHALLIDAIAQALRAAQATP